MSRAQRSAHWRIVARNYDRVWRTRALSILTGGRFPPKEELRLVADTINVGAARLILDNACANAIYSRGLARRMNQKGLPGVIIANDLSLEMLRQARSMAVRERVNHRILFVRSDSEHMPFAASSFDGIVCGGSLNEFSSPRTVLSEIRRTLRPGGYSSMMHQVLSDNLLIAGLQKGLVWCSGLTFLSYSEAMALLSEEFKVEVIRRAGTILMTRLSSSTPHHTHTVLRHRIHQLRPSAEAH